MSRKYAYAAVAGCLLLVSCTTGDTFDRQVLETRDASSSSTVYYSNRDAGFSARLSGTNTNGLSRTRDLWVFGDSGGWDATGTQFAGLGFPTNTASLVSPKTAGSSPPVAPLPSAVTKDAQGHPLAFVGFISGGAAYPTCIAGTPGQPGEYAAQWPNAVIRLPDNDARFETALVFYQNWCVRLLPSVSYRPFDGGVAVMTWDANNPDTTPTATVLNDRLFAPGRFINQWLPNGLEKGGTYGEAPYFKPGTTNELIVLQCGNASHCTTARWVYDTSKTVQQNLDTVKLRASWRYRNEGPTTAHNDDQWLPLPPVDGTPDNDCTPTSDEACAPTGTYPVAKRVLTASSDPLTQVWGAPSIAVQGNVLLMTYMPGPPAASFDLDHAAVRMSAGDGIFNTPAKGNLPAGICTKGCYAPVLHPELNHDSWIYFSYYAKETVTLPSGLKIGSLRIGRSCVNEFNGGGC
ncbi:MAG TPA: hypothetical protein VK524_00010 [Polyangiaceae bacterium]|nr:hypothetical protein [Polyangiaceae bacterium]